MRTLLLGLLVVVVAVGAVLLLRGGRHLSAPTTTGSAPAKTTAVQAYFYRGPALEPVVVHVPRTRAVGTAALRALLAGPPVGLRTAIPSAAGLLALRIVGATAIATFTDGLGFVPRTAQAQIVYTLTQFPSVRRVRIVMGLSQAVVPLADGSGRTVVRPATRADYADLTTSAPIFVAAPLRDATVSSPVRVSGTASVFEGTLTLEVWSAGKRLKTVIVTATAGAPERGDWSQTLDLAPASYRLLLYEPSAENGAHLHATTVDFTVGS